jgi:hypothetical protein
MSFARRPLKRFALIIVYIFGGLLASAAQTPKPTEYQVKAAYLYNFGKFVNWPKAANGDPGNFVICVFGQDPFGSLLDSTVAGESVSGKPVDVERIAKRQDADRCRIIFISASEQARVRDILTDFAQLNALTVSDMPSFTSRGGMIQFVVRDDRVRFEVNLTAADRAGISLSSELLKVAAAVRKDQEPEN